MSISITFKCLRPRDAAVNVQDLFKRVRQDAHGDCVLRENGWIVLRDDNPDGEFRIDADPRFAEEVALEGTTHGGLFSFQRVKEGQVTRRLQHWEEGGWTVVEGTPEPWEAGLFSERGLERELEYAEEDGEDPDAVRAFFAAKTLRKGSRIPRTDGTLAFAVLDDLGFKFHRHPLGGAHVEARIDEKTAALRAKGSAALAEVDRLRAEAGSQKRLMSTYGAKIEKILDAALRGSS